jgi:hypothetical protein
MKLAAISIIAIALSLDTTQAQTTQSPHLNAPAELQKILTTDAAARKAGDSTARLTAALQLNTLLNSSPAALLATAHAYSVLKDSANTFESLKAYARLEITNKAIINNEDKKFAWLNESKTFEAIRQQLKENATPISLTTKAIEFPDTSYLVEDIGCDTTSKTFLFTSILKHAVYRLDWKGKCSLFTTSTTGWPVMAIKIDNKRGLVWTTEMLIPGFDNQPDTIKAQSVVVSFNLHSGKQQKRIEAPEGAQWGDMILDPEGNPIVADGQSGAIFRLRENTWQRLDKGDFISPQTPALTEDGRSLIVPDYERGLAIMNIENGDLTWITSNPEHPCPLTGIDGVYKIDNRLFITQNGLDPERVQQIELKGNILKNNIIIEKGTKALGDPTHGVLINNTFYFIANSGWDVLDAHGKLTPGARMTKPTLMKYPIPQPASR